MRLSIAVSSMILVFATSQPHAFLIDSQHPPQPGSKQGDEKANQGVPRKSDSPPIDVSSEVSLTIVPARDRYEQLEPIKLKVDVTNNSKIDMYFKDESECRMFGFVITDVTSNLAVEDVTRYGKMGDDGKGKGRIVLKPGGSRRFDIYPNLCMDMTLPRRYSIALTMGLTRSPDDRRCVTRSKLVFVEVTPLFKGR